MDIETTKILLDLTAFEDTNLINIIIKANDSRSSINCDFLLN